MTTVRQFADVLKIGPGHISLAISHLKAGGLWTGEDFTEIVTIRRSDNQENTREVRSLSEEQQAQIKETLIRMGENSRARNPEIISFARHSKEGL